MILAVCGGLLSGSSGPITSYRFGDSNFTDRIDCAWDISIPLGYDNYTIVFIFDVFEIPESSRCAENSLRLDFYNCKQSKTKLIISKIINAVQQLVIDISGTSETFSVEIRPQTESSLRFLLRAKGIQITDPLDSSSPLITAMVFVELMVIIIYKSAADILTILRESTVHPIIQTIIRRIPIVFGISVLIGGRN